jgi:hypothetical protein
VRTFTAIRAHVYAIRAHVCANRAHVFEQLFSSVRSMAVYIRFHLHIEGNLSKLLFRRSTAIFKSSFTTGKLRFKNLVCLEKSSF